MTVLASASSFGEVGNEPLELLQKNGFNIINNPYGRKLTEDEVITLAKNCIGIVAGLEPLTARVMDALPGLRCISRVGIGMDNVDLEYAKQKGIIVVNTPDAPTRSVAEFTLGIALSLLRKIPQADAALKSRKWGKQIGNLIQDKVIGVIGLGRIGKLVAELFRGIGNTVIGYGHHAEEEWGRKNSVGLTDFNTLLKTADIITLHVPSKADKIPVIGPAEFELVKNSAFIINMSRGGVVDEDALYNALKTNKLSGAAVDVFNDEPYAGPLCDLQNIILTPHIGSSTREGKLVMETEAVNNLLAALNK